MVTLFKRSNGILYLEFIQYGKKVQRSTKLEDTPTNRAFIKREIIPPLKQKILSGEFDKEKPKEFGFYSGIYSKEKEHLKSYHKILTYLKSIDAYFGDTTIDKINRGHVKDYLALLLQSMTPKTAKNYLISLRGVFYVAFDREAIKLNPTLDIKLPKHQPKEIEPFTPVEVKKLLDTARGDIRLYLAIAFYTGARSGEILAFKKSDFDFDTMTINIERAINEGRLTTPKTQSSIRTVPILKELVPYLDFDWDMDYLFTRKDGEHYNSFGGHYRDNWNKLLKDTNIDYRPIYTTRHTFIVSMLKHSNLSVIEIAQIVGHTNTHMIIKHYAKYIKNEHLRVDRSISIY